MPQNIKKKFRLTRAFSIVSLIGIILVAVIMTQIHRSVSVDSLLKVQNEANIDLTRAFSNSIWKKYIDFFNRSSSIPKHEIILQPEIAQLENDLKRQMRGVRVVKIKVYNRNGLTVFSTDVSQIGDDKSENPGFLSALNGEVKNEISFRDKFNAFDMVIEDRNLLASYIPVQYGPQNEVVAVFELYSDITSLLNEIDEAELKSVALGSVLMLVLYAFLLIYVRRADMVIKRHEDEEREIQEQRIKYISENDVLTGLPNRQSVVTQLNKLFERSKLKTGRVTLFYFDIHRFKLVNDNLGQEFGDRVLLELVARLNESVRAASLIGRVGPDEFLLAVENLSDRVVDSILVRVIRSLTEPYEIDSSVAQLSVSVGIVHYPDDATDAQSALKSGEAAVLRAKELGKNRFAYFTNDLNKRAVERFALENALSHALEKDQFEVFYQPRMDTNGNTVSAEALLRWRRDDGQLISPALFINVLEDTELIIPVGYWVLLNACRECVKWHQQGFTTMKISVNLSIRQFLGGGIIEDIRKALLESGLEAEFLELELTESLFAENPDETLSILKAIKAFGIHISLDDFGTGYSSLSYLRKFPIDCLKIDQSFVRDISTNLDQANLTQSIINMAKALDMTTVAEGIEEEEQFDCLVRQDVNELQGFYFSRPLSSDDFLAFLNKAK